MLCMSHGRNIYQTRHIQTHLWNICVPWTARAIWTKISTKGEGTFLHFPSAFLTVPFRSLLYLSRSAGPLSRIRRDRYCFLFPRGMLGQFQIGEQRSRSVWRQMYVGHFRGWSREVVVGPGDCAGLEEDTKGEVDGIQRIPISTKYEIWKVPSANIVLSLERISFTSQRNGTVQNVN